MATAQPPTTPPKLFREEAKTGAVQCPACGGPITLKGFGAIERVACPYCGSELSPEDSGALALLQQAQRQRRQSALPLHQRGTLDDVQWEILGIVWRECRVDGIVYPWQEFLLYNPWHGYRYLVFSMSDGHWTLGEPLAGAPQVLPSLAHKKVQFKKDKYKHFQTVKARVSYVEGEFPWQVHVGDEAVAHEYVLPPYSISIEEEYGPNGQDVNFTMMRHIEGSEVWKAFRLSGAPPPVSGVGTVQPNPWKKGRWLTWTSMAGMLLLWMVAAFLYVGGRDPHTVFSRSGVDISESFTEQVKIGEPGEDTTLQLDFKAYPLSNAWAYVDVMLISQDSEEAIGFGATAEEWHGVSGGESWREGDSTPTEVIGNVPGGTYTLQITPSAGGATGKPAPTNLRYDLRLREDVVLMRYILLPLLVILGFPILYFFFGAVFEGRRWANSDYASSE